MPDSLTQRAPIVGAARILAVDDEPYVRDLVARWMKGAGHACDQAGNVEEALDYLRDHDADLIVLDVNMPGRSGFDLLDEIKYTHPNLAVLMMTGTGDAKAAIHALTHGAWGYLVKPVEREEVLFQVQAALERRQMLLERENYTRDLEEKVRRQTAEVRAAHDETIQRLVTASLCRDEETGMHIRRTGLLSEVLARGAGWSDSDAERIRMAAPMHDVGKIGIPDAILRKPSKLTPEEFNVMKQHTIIGAKMLAGSYSPILTMAHDIALNHHERWDGTGYPHGTAGTNIPEAARIVSIVDVYDALCHKRVYHDAWPEEEVLKYMRRGMGSQFDPMLLAVFLSLSDDMRRISEENPDESSSDKPDMSFEFENVPIVEACPAAV